MVTQAVGRLSTGSTDESGYWVLAGGVDHNLVCSNQSPYPLPPRPTASLHTFMNTEALRNQMVEQQVHTWEVFDERVLNAMRVLRREEFMPAGFRDLAFADAPIPLPQGQHVLPPKVQGRILQTLELNLGDVALEVGAGSGYLTACMAKLCSRVRSLEIHPDLTEFARANLLASAINNAAVETMDAMRLDEVGQYDAIAVTGSLPLYDERFQRALKIGGRMFVVVGTAPVMEAWKVTRLGDREWQRESLFETIIDSLTNAARTSSFVF
jgi:protein-L-isoaspartate(D-aspartate) O-methyltransferase